MTLLCLVPVSGLTSIFAPSRFGDIFTVRFEHPEFKRLTAGMINELKFTVRDDRGRVLDNHGQPFLANVNSRSRSLYAIARPSVVCLSVVCLSVTLVRPTQAVQIFGNISMAFGTLAIC